MRLGLDEHGGVHGRQVAPPVKQGAAFDGHLGGADDQAVALPVPVEYGAWLAADVHWPIDAE
ncbi:hypothetical protein D9M68_911300 [compost metagenome]